MLFTKLTGKKLIFNSSLLMGFMFLLALPFATFLITPLPGLTNKGAVLSAKNTDYSGYLTIGGQVQPLFMREVWATAFSGKTATYDSVLTVQNTFGVIKTFKIKVISDTITNQQTSAWTFKNGQSEIKLKPLEESGVSLALSNDSADQSRAHFWVLVTSGGD